MGAQNTENYNLFTQKLVKTMDFALLVRSEDEKGQSRDMIKKIGDLEAIYKVIKDDINYYMRETENLSKDNNYLKYDLDKIKDEYRNQDKKNQKDTEIIKVGYTNIIGGLENKTKDLRIQIENLERELEQEKKDKERITREKNNEIQQLKNSYEKLLNEFRQLERDSTRRINDLQLTITKHLENFEIEKKDLIQKYEEQQIKLKGNYENQISKLTQDNTTQVNQQMNELESKNFLIQSMQQEMNDLQSNTQKEMQELIQKLAAIIAEQDRQKNENECLRSDIVNAKRKLEEVQREVNLDLNNQLKNKQKKNLIDQDKIISSQKKSLMNIKIKVIQKLVIQ